MTFCRNLLPILISGILIASLAGCSPVSPNSQTNQDQVQNTASIDSSKQSDKDRQESADSSDSADSNDAADHSSVSNGCAEDAKACEALVKADESSFTPISFDEAIAFFQKGKTGVLYFGFPDCPWCQEIVPLLKEEAEKEGIEIFYVRTRDDNKDRLYSDEQKAQIQPYIASYMSDNEEGELTLYVPLVVSVIDGQAVAGHQGTVDGHDAHERLMTKEEKEEADWQIREVIASQVR